MTHFFLYVCSIQTFDNYSLVNKSFPVSGTDVFTKDSRLPSKEETIRYSNTVMRGEN